MFRLFLVCLLAAAGVPAASPARRSAAIAELFRRSPALWQGHVGFEFVDLESGAVLAAQNASLFFTPASNTKLYTTALALSRLGKEYEFITELTTRGFWNSGQSSLPDLEIVGGGDPNLSGRVLPYAVDAVDTDPLAVLKEFASKLSEAGVREVRGDVVGVTSRYSGGLYPDGWTVDDITYSYGAPVTALALNDNAIGVTVAATEPGELAEVTLVPATRHLIVCNQVVSDASKTSDIHVSSDSSSNEIVIRGTIGQFAGAWHEDVAVHDPALFTAQELTDALEAHGIAVEGDARSEYNAGDGGTILATHHSAPLWQDLEVVNKVSQNLHAEMLLREVAFQRRGAGTIEAGQAERNSFLSEIGITEPGRKFPLADGSGLARQDLTTPAATVALLKFMWARPDREVWLRTFPIGGVDGSLEHRFARVKGAERIHAKTGSIAHVNTLSGYLETKHHHWLAFSLMINSTASSSPEVHDFMDQLCAVFLDE